MKKISKPPFFVYISTMLLLIVILLFGCASPTYETQSSPAKAGVRQPKGNPETFWNKFNWADLTAAEQDLWRKLGWNEDSWDGKAPPPPTEKMDWNELSPDERKAAKLLGYGRFYWDSN